MTQNPKPTNNNTMRAKVLAIAVPHAEGLALQNVFSKFNYEFIATETPTSALSLISEHSFAFVLLDFDPQKSGSFPSLQRLTTALHSAKKPSVFVMANSLSREDEEKVYASGATDILYRPISLPILESKIKNQIGGLTASLDDDSQTRAFFDGEGELYRLFKEKDWKRTALGAVETWPQSLRTAVSIMLDSQFPMVIAWGKRRVFLYNDSYIPILGNRHPQAFGEPFDEVWSDVWETVLPLVDSVDRGKAIFVEDLPLQTTRHGHDEVFYATFSYSPIRDEENQIAGLFCAIVETTSRKHSEDALKASELSLVDTLESMSDAFVSVDSAWTITRVNRHFEMIFQSKREDRIGKNFLDVWFARPLSEHSDYLINFREAMIGRTEVRFEHFYENIAMWTEVRIYPKQDGGLAIFFTDISELKRNELMATNAKVKFEQSVDVSPAILWITEVDGICTYLSKQWYEYTGQTMEEALGFGWLNATHPEDKERTQRIFVDANKRRAHFYVEYRLKTKSGQYRWAIDAGNPRYDENGKYLGYAGTVFDINERKHAEAEMKIAKVEAELARAEAERANALKSSFLANMSHEIRTPLGAILGFSHLLRDRTIEATEKDQYLDTIVRNGNSLTRIIDDILDLAKVEAGKLDVEEVSFSLYKLAAEVVDLFKDKTTEKDIYLLLNIDESVPFRISSDPTRVRQILVNLIGNAVKFTDKGGVRVSIRATSLANKKVTVFVDVKDTGIGLTEEQTQKLFNPFTQADNSTTRKFGGTGLGLALSQRLSQALAGEISISDFKLGEGATFSLRFTAGLPADSSRIESQSAKSEVREIISLRGLNVLIIDDSPDNQLLAARLLSKNGAKVETASDGEEGVRKALAGTFDIVLMDIQMPKLDGYQAKHELDKFGYDKPVIALTAHAMSDEREKTKAAGFAGHHTKPLNGSELLKTIAALNTPHTGTQAGSIRQS